MICFYRSAGHGKCLQDKPRQSLQFMEKVKDTSEIQPGEQYDINKQCSQAFGQGSKLCPYTSGEVSQQPKMCFSLKQFLFPCIKRCVILIFV